MSVVGIWNGKDVAIKQVTDETLFKTEFDAMKQLQHENVVCLLGICLDGLLGALYIVMELLKKGSLLNYLRIEAYHGGLGTEEILRVAKEVKYSILS